MALGDPGERFAGMSFRVISLTGKRGTHPRNAIDVATDQGNMVCAMPWDVFASLGLPESALRPRTLRGGAVWVTEDLQLDMIGWADCEFMEATVPESNVVVCAELYVARNIETVRVSQNVLSRLNILGQRPSLEHDRTAPPTREGAALDEPSGYEGTR